MKKHLINFVVSVAVGLAIYLFLDKFWVANTGNCGCLAPENAVCNVSCADPLLFGRTLTSLLIGISMFAILTIRQKRKSKK